MHNMASREFQDLLRFVPNQEVGSEVENIIELQGRIVITIFICGS